MAQEVERSPVVELFPNAVEQHPFRRSPVGFHQRFPGFGLRGLHPRQHIRREKRPHPVIASCVALGIQPAIGGEVFANLRL